MTMSARIPNRFPVINQPRLQVVAPNTLVTQAPRTAHTKVPVQTHQAFPRTTNALWRTAGITTVLTTSAISTGFNFLGSSISPDVAILGSALLIAAGITGAAVGRHLFPSKTGPAPVSDSIAPLRQITGIDETRRVYATDPHTDYSKPDFAPRCGIEVEGELFSLNEILAALNFTPGETLTVFRKLPTGSVSMQMPLNRKAAIAAAEDAGVRFEHKGNNNWVATIDPKLDTSTANVKRVALKVGPNDYTFIRHVIDALNANSATLCVGTTPDYERLFSADSGLVATNTTIRKFQKAGVTFHQKTDGKWMATLSAEPLQLESETTEPDYTKPQFQNGQLSIFGTKFSLSEIIEGMNQTGPMIIALDSANITQASDAITGARTANKNNVKFITLLAGIELKRFPDDKHRAVLNYPNPLNRNLKDKIPIAIDLLRFPDDKYKAVISGGDHVNMSLKDRVPIVIEFNGRYIDVAQVLSSLNHSFSTVRTYDRPDFDNTDVSTTENDFLPTSTAYKALQDAGIEFQTLNNKIVAIIEG
jgi:hypothetical protein